MSASHVAWIACVGTIVVAVALAAVGALRVVKLGIALKKRAAAYKSLPLRAFVDGARAKVARTMPRIDTVPALVYRTQAALRDIANARVKIAAIVRSPSAVWRLGALIVTGK